MRATRSLLCSSMLPVFLVLSGCGTGPLATRSLPLSAAASLSGTVHGGQQPVVGARVFILQASGFGYGGQSYDAIYQKYGSGSVPAGILYDAQRSAYYLTTDSQGAFSIGGDYSCTDSRPLYLLALGGNPGLGPGKANPALAELAVLGTCSAGATLPTSANLSISELTTVAGVYALSGFLTAPQFMASRTAQNGAVSPSDLGLNNAAATALSFFDPSTGALLSTTASGGIVPVARINLLANILAACINSDGTGIACTTLFSKATSDGTPTGTSPPETVTALLNIAHNPAANAAALASLVTANARYQPIAPGTPADLTLQVTFPLQYTAASTGTVALNPNLPTIDATGNILVPGTENGTGSPSGATEVFSNLGKPLAGSNQASTASPFAVNKWAIDQAGNAWAAPTAVQRSTAAFARLTPSTGVITTYPQTHIPSTAYDTAIDASGNIYFPDSVSQRVNEYTSSGQFVAEGNSASLGIAIDSGNTVYDTSANPAVLHFGADYTTAGGGLLNPGLLALDNNQGIWTANSNNTLSKFTLTSSSTLVPDSPAGGFTGGGLAFDPNTQPYIQVALDGFSHAWAPNYAGQTVSQFDSTGTPMAPAGYATGCKPKGMAIDGSGNVWVTCDNPTYTPNAQTLREFIGLAAPTATPLLPNQTGTRP